MLLLALLSCAPPPPPDVLIVTLDTTRADALGAYGASPSPTPNVDALAARGVRVDEAMSVTPLTLPAHASMFTGLDPGGHGVRDNLGSPLAHEAVTLAERMRDAGWRTGAFVGAIVLDGSFGLDQGYEIYDDGFDLTADRVPGDALVQWTADEVRERAVRWLADANAGPMPVFTWVHLYDPHQPLTPPARFLEQQPDPYLAEVAYADEVVGKVITAAQRPGRELIVVVVGDHGEGNGEHGEQQHGLFVYRSTMRVPFVVAGPGVPEGAVLAGPRSITDVTPTVLELTGQPVPEGLDGRSLVPALRGEPDGRTVYGESWHGRFQYGFAELRVLQDDRWRYVLAPEPELYDWKADPGETDNRVAAQPEVAERMKAALLARADQAPAPSSADDAAREALAALGYLEAAATVPVDVSYADLPDPKGRPDMVERFEALIVAARTRPPAEAVPLLEAFLAENPGVGGARYLLSTARELAGDPRGAREALAPLLEARPTDAGLRTRTADLLLAEGRVDEAKALVRAVVDDQPTYAAAWAVLAEIARRGGDCAEAVRLVDEGLAKAPESSRLRLVRGACRMDVDPRGAEDDLRAVLASDPGDEDAGFLLALVLARDGRVDEALPLFEAQVARSPDDPLSRAALGLGLYRAGRYAEAIPHLEAAAPHAVVGEEPPTLLADAILRTGGDLGDVEAWLAMAEARAPGTAAAHRVRSALLMARGDVEGALAEMEAADRAP